MNRTLFDDGEPPSDEEIRAGIEADFKRLRRNTDPATSDKAARYIAPRLGSLQKWVLDIVRDYPGSTSSELAQVKNIGDPRIINRRLPELEVLQLVRRGEERKCGVTGREAATWYVK